MKTFCQTHYNLLQLRWDSNLQNAYPGEIIDISETSCDFLGCPISLKGQTFCPCCKQPLRELPKAKP